jgi:hypothetical protein
VTYIIHQRALRLDQVDRVLPDVGFHISNHGTTYAIKAEIVVTLAQGPNVFGSPGEGHYDGKYLWNLNPQAGVNGHFKLPAGISINESARLRARVDVTLIDYYERRHKLLPVGFIHMLGQGDEWYFEPSEEAFAIPAKKTKPLALGAVSS